MKTSSITLVVQLTLKIWLLSVVLAPCLYTFVDIFFLQPTVINLADFLGAVVLFCLYGVIFSVPTFCLLTFIAYPIMIFIKGRVLLKKVLLLFICGGLCLSQFFIFNFNLFEGELPILFYYYFGVQAIVILSQSKSRFIY